MKKRGKMKMFVIIGVLLSVVGIALVFFNIPYSKTRTEFNHLTGSIIIETDKGTGIITENDIADLPTPVQNYFKFCGFIGIHKMAFMKVVYHDVDFLFGKDKPTMKIDYIQYNFASVPMRIAYINSAIYGITFEGLDAYVHGKGSMKGVIAKIHTLFNQTGDIMDKASLVTFLSECLLIPSVALQNYIIWEEIDDVNAKATISYYGETASGIFTFDEKNESVTFTTNDRVFTATDGTTDKVTWSTVSSDYQEKDGIKTPTEFKAIWEYKDGDLVYFDGKGLILYDTEE